MNTQSHAILTFYVLRRGLGRRLEGIGHLNAVLFSGALAPDLPLYVFFAWYTVIVPTPQRVIWGDLYFRDGWQALFSSFHSLPVWAFAAVVCRALKRPGATLFCLAGLLAAFQDFLVHHEDAHAHFYPITRYRFASPVSYWNPAYYGQYFSAAEVGAVLAASVWTYRRLETVWGKGILLAAAATLVANHTMWSLIFTHW